MEINEPRESARIKWGYALSRITGLPPTWGQARGCVAMNGNPPATSDVLIAQIGEIGLHTRIDLAGGVKSQLFPGDLVGLTFAPRYATRRIEAVVPDTLHELHFVCAGGVCGQVVGRAMDLLPPTTLRPLGYLMRNGARVNLRDFALRPTGAWCVGVDVVVVAGASMDSGKTTAAYSLIHGLTNGGLSVAGAKVTGTATANDPLLMGDAGARLVVDFTDAGYGSTADLSQEELGSLSETLISNLAVVRPEAIVIEIADGITQRETVMLLRHFGERGIRGVIYACNDSLSVRAGVERLRGHGLEVLAVSGVVSKSPLSTREAQLETNVPVLTREDLMDSSIADRLGIGPRAPMVTRRSA